jgi:hypothetical protein
MAQFWFEEQPVVQILRPDRVTSASGQRSKPTGMNIPKALASVADCENIAYTQHTAPDSTAECAFLHAGALHGVETLLWATQPSDVWSDSVRTILAAAVINQVAAATARATQMRALAELLDRHAIPSIVLKGAALAQTHYAKHWHRPSADIDLLIAPASRENAFATLAAAGWHSPYPPSCELTTYQSTWSHPASEIEHDLHWRLSDVQKIAYMVDFSELYEASVELDSGLSSARWRPNQRTATRLYTSSHTPACTILLCGGITPRRAFDMAHRRRRPVCQPG